MDKLYILSYTYSPGSAVTNHALSLVRGLCENGCSVEWVFLLPGGEMERVSDTFTGLTVKYLWSRRFSKGKVLKHAIKHLLFGWFYFRTLKKGDIVLLMGMSAYVNNLVKRKGIFVFHERTEHPDAVKDVRYDCFLEKYKKACPYLDGLFVISNSLKEYFIEIGVPKEKITVINMVVDSNRFTGIKKQIVEQPYIAYCGNASNSKDGVDDLIKSFRLVLNSVHDVNLMIIGPTPSPQSSNQLLVDRLGIKDRVIFTGLISPEQMPQMLKNASVLALARPDSIQNKYGFPTKLGEYLLSGNPVCVTRVGDIPQFLTHNKTALLSNCGDCSAFADNLIWCLLNQEEAQKIGEKGKEVAKTYFNYLHESKKMVIAMNINDNN